MLARLVAGSRAYRHIVVSLTGAGTLAPTLDSAGIEVIALNLRPGATALLGLPRLVRLIRQHRPVLVQTWLYHADLLGLIAARLAGCRQQVVWNLRCSNMDHARYGRLVALLARLSSRPSAVFSNSLAGRDWHQAQGYHPRIWRVIANGIDTTRFRPDPVSRAAWRSRLGIGAETVLVGMVARVDPMKDHPTFLSAAADIASAHPNIAFIVAGRDTEHLPATGVIRLGEIGDTAGLYAALDIAVQTSSFGEGFPNVVAEAMACGLPVIASDSGDASSIIADTGRVLPIGNADALKAAILDLAASPQRRQQLGEAARLRIEQEYGLALTITAFETAWSEIVATKGSPP